MHNKPCVLQQAGTLLALSEQHMREGWMDDLGYYVMFNNISVISGQWADDNESCMKWNCLQLRRFCQASGAQIGTARSVGQCSTHWPTRAPLIWGSVLFTIPLVSSRPSVIHHWASKIFKLNGHPFRVSHTATSTFVSLLNGVHS